VPEWIKAKPEDPNKLVQEFGHGKRQRKQVNYNDDLSEAQFLKTIEIGGDLNEEAERQRRRRQDNRNPPPGGKTGLRKSDALSSSSDSE
jgi:hypothetical protein